MGLGGNLTVTLPNLRFGIPSLDVLFGGSGAKAGITLPNSETRQTTSPDTGVSLCLSGPDGTGKSILGLHLATHYVADCAHFGEAQPKVLYISTDLKFGMAEKVWKNFALDWPNRRTIPFVNARRKDSDLQVELTECSPLKGATEDKTYLSHLLLHASPAERRVHFVDLAAATAGDDWGFINRILSTLEEPGENQPRHLMVLDSVEGFETLVGKYDAFGLMRERRSRIAQVMRSAGEKFHMLFVIEEPKEGERMPEDFVADVVIRLRSTPVQNYIRRSIEIEKARGHSHVRGQHIYLIRSGVGSFTGLSSNADDPQITNISDEKGPLKDRQPHQSYLHVCHSLHHSYRRVMSYQAEGRVTEPPERYAAFGIRYLDDMLGTKTMPFKRAEGDDQRGLRWSTTTALIGNAETQKGPLGVAFLCRCFRDYAERFYQAIEQIVSGAAEPYVPSNFAEALQSEQARNWLKERYAADEMDSEAAQNWLRHSVWRHFDAVSRRIGGALIDPKDSNQGSYFTPGTGKNGALEIDPVVRAAAWAVGPPNFKPDGIPVLLTTQDVHAQKLALDFLPWLLRKVPQLKSEQFRHPGCLSALRILMETYTVCRRLEIHDLPSAVLIHILQSAIAEAHAILYGQLYTEMQKRSVERSGMIRVVIDDFSILKDTYIEIREEPLLLRFMVFYLGQQGVTTLLIDTQPGRPDTTLANPLHSELRSLVDNRIFTWRFPFYGEDRVAITVNLPISMQSPAVIRELRRSSEIAVGPESLPLVVDPHFELYSGIEKGEPQPIPIEVWLFEETPAFKNYIDEENLRYAELFTPRPRPDRHSPTRVITGIPSTDYDRLRDFCYLQRDTRLDHTLVFQVDEFWMMSTPLELRSTGVFRSQKKYLDAITAEHPPGRKWEPEWAADPFRLFQRTKATRPDPQKSRYHRKDEFNFIGYQQLGPDEAEGLTFDRVPFTWDFGFMLCKVRAWIGNENRAELTIWRSSKQKECEETGLDFGTEWGREEFKNPADVWNGLPKATQDGQSLSKKRPSWRVFLEACYQLAQKQSYSKLTPVTAFSMYGASVQTLSSLILEIWASEIYERERRNGDEAKVKKVANQVKARRWPQKPTNYGAVGAEEEEAPSLIEWLEEYRLELFKTWLLLIEVVDFRELAKAVKNNELADLKSDATAVAVRHWYKTACQATENLTFDDPLVPVGLPGHFSVRGDWFLAVVGGSRSGRLADRALDLLSSRRANYTRLKKGLGLPTRILDDLERKDGGAELSTSIITLDSGSREAAGSSSQEDRETASLRLSRVKYINLLKIGGSEKGTGDDDGDFHWFWRSGLRNYDRQTRTWQDWLRQMILWWDRMRYIERDNWINGFERYDRITSSRKIYGEEKVLGEDGKDLRAWSTFNNRCELLIDELKQATLNL